MGKYYRGKILMNWADNAKFASTYEYSETTEDLQSDLPTLFHLGCAFNIWDKCCIES